MGKHRDFRITIPAPIIDQLREKLLKFSMLLAVENNLDALLMIPEHFPERLQPAPKAFVPRPVKPLLIRHLKDNHVSAEVQRRYKAVIVSSAIAREHLVD
jgi:hypothetical protein